MNAYVCCQVYLKLLLLSLSLTCNIVDILIITTTIITNALCDLQHFGRNGSKSAGEGETCGCSVHIHHGRVCLPQAAQGTQQQQTVLERPQGHVHRGGGNGRRRHGEKNENCVGEFFIFSMTFPLVQVVSHSLIACSICVVVCEGRYGH